MFWRQNSSQRPLLSSPSVTPNELLEILLEHTYGYYVLPIEPYDEVFPNIILGDSTTALCIHLLRRLGVTHVLNAAWGRQRNLGLVNTSASFYRNAQIEFMGIEALDMSVFPLYQHFYSAAEFIERALAQPNGKVLVHCGEGISRSSTLVIAYLMIKQGFTVQDAIRKVVKHRNILPNQGFLLQLCQLNDELGNGKANPSVQLRAQSEFVQRHLEDIESPISQPKIVKPLGADIMQHTNVNYNGNSLSAPFKRSTTPSPVSTPISNILPNFNSPSYTSSRSSTPVSGNISRSSSAYSSTATNNSFTKSNGNYSSTNTTSGAYIPSPIEKYARKLSYRRAQSVERPSYITRGSGYLSTTNKKSSSSYYVTASPSSYSKLPPSRSSSSSSTASSRCFSRSPSPRSPTPNFYSSNSGSSGNLGYSLFTPYNSLMTAYLVNRPLPAMSR